MEQQEQPQQATKKVSRKLKILVIIAGAIILYYAIAMVYAYIRIQNGDLTKWNGKWYTQEELAKQFPPQYAESVAKNTPEGVYATFRQALLDNNLELALQQITEQHKEEYRGIFSSYKNLHDLGVIYPETITKESEYGNFSYFKYEFVRDEKIINSRADFFKDVTGYWKIDSI